MGVAVQITTTDENEKNVITFADLPPHSLTPLATGDQIERTVKKNKMSLNNVGNICDKVHNSTKYIKVQSLVDI